MVSKDAVIFGVRRDGGGGRGALFSSTNLEMLYSWEPGEQKAQ